MVKKPKEPRTGVLFLQGIDRNLHRHFKAYCAQRGISMTRMVELMMREVVCAEGEEDKPKEKQSDSSKE